MLSLITFLIILKMASSINSLQHFESRIPLKPIWADSSYLVVSSNLALNSLKKVIAWQSYALKIPKLSIRLSDIIIWPYLNYWHTTYIIVHITGQKNLHSVLQIAALIFFFNFQNCFDSTNICSMSAKSCGHFILFFYLYQQNQFKGPFYNKAVNATGIPRDYTNHV